MIKVKNLCKSYDGKVNVNDNISFEIEKGKILGVVGENGAGKTTLIKQIVGLLSKTSGEIEYSIDIDTTKFISYFSQSSMILNSQTAFECIYYTGVFRGLQSKEAKSEAHRLIEKFNITSFKDKVMMRLSGGEKKLVNIASAFIGNYPLIIFDEPTNDLDVLKRNTLWNEIVNYRKKYGTTFIIISHNLQELEGVVDDVLVIKNGKLVINGPINEIKNKYNDMKKVSIYFEDKYEEELSKEFLDYTKVKGNVIVKHIKANNITSELNRVAKYIEEYKINVTVSADSLEELYLKLHLEGDSYE